jgi:hypothetical protein
MTTIAPFASLMDRLRAGDRDAAIEFLKRCFHQLIGEIRKRPHGDAEPEGVANSVLWSFFQFFEKHKGADFEAEDFLWSKLLEITRRHCEKHKKRAFRERDRFGPLLPGETVADHVAAAHSPVDEACSRELCQRLISHLSPQQCEIFNFILQGFKENTIAGLLGVSARTVYRTKEKIKVLLDEWYDG